MAPIGTMVSTAGVVAGVVAQPVGVYEIRDGETEWKPAVDVNALAKGGQVLAGIIAMCVTLVVLRRQK